MKERKLLYMTKVNPKKVCVISIFIIGVIVITFIVHGKDIGKITQEGWGQW